MWPELIRILKHTFFLEWLLHVFGRGHCAMPAYLCALSFTLSRLKQQVFKASWELDARNLEIEMQLCAACAVILIYIASRGLDAT